jgi:hypothetical protein
MAKKKPKKTPGRLIVLGISMVILLAFAVIATVTVGVQQGWQIPGIGSIGVGIGTITGSQGTGYSTTSGYTTTGSGPVCTGSSCPSGSVLPPGTLGFNMALVGVFSDNGPNSTISSQQGLPGLDAISIGGRPLKFVDAQSVVGYVSSAPLPAGSTAEFRVNETSLNEHSNFVNWHYYDYTTGFVKNNTVALFLLPDFPISGIQVFADSCQSNSTGGVNCNLPNGTIQTRRVDWNVRTTVTITTPNLAVLPLTYSNVAVAAADFDGRHMVGCTNCGGGPGPGNPNPPPAALPATFNGNGNGETRATINAPTPPTNPCVGSSCGPVTTTTCAPCINANNQVARVTVTGHTTDSVGRTTSGSGTTSSGARGLGSAGNQCLNVLPSLCIIQSLLPVNYVSLSVGSPELVNPWALALFAAIWVAVMMGIIGFVLLARRWLR